MVRTLELRVTNPVTTLLAVAEAEWVHVRLANGTGLTVYPGHAPLLAETVSGPLRYTDGDDEHAFQVSAGILQIAAEEVKVLTSGQAEGEKGSWPCAVSEEHRFERLARQLQGKLETEASSELTDILTISDE